MGRRRLLYGCVVMAALWCNIGQAQSLSGGTAQWPPYSYQDENGRATGIAVDVMRRVMAQSDNQMAIVFLPVKRLNALLEQGRLDLNYADSPAWNAPGAAQRFV